MRGEILFWGFMALIAAFLLFYGNDMYDKKYEKIKEVEKQRALQKQMELNVSKE
jgi:uncharacterized membrane protein YjfL (UPF0719 family)